MQPSFDSLSGKKFGDFILEERIGRGGAATVYRAQQQSVRRDVALKVIDLTQIAEHDDFQLRFAKEAELIAKLEHIHILPVYAYGIDDDKAYLAMRILRGGSLKDLIKRKEILPIDTAISLFRQIAQGLAYAHSKGIIHRDIKPGNVLLDDNGNAYLSDFGLAKLINSEADVTQGDVIVGTLAYMSPEHLRGERLDQRADVYSMAIMLYEMLCGRVPFVSEPGEDVVGLVYKHLETPPPPMNTFNLTIPPTLEGVIMRALSKKREDRYFDMGEFVQAVNVALGLSSSDSFPRVAQLMGTSTRTQAEALKKQQQTRSLMLLVGAVILTVLIGVVVLIASNRETPIPPHIIRDSESIAWDALKPSPEQIALAQRKLGTDGFVAVIQCNSTSEYHTTLTRETTTRLRNYGLKFRVYDSKSDGYIQRTEMEKALTDGAQAFIICPITYDTISQTLRAINDEGFPMVSTTKPEVSFGGVYTASIGSEYEMGEAIGRFAGLQLKLQKREDAKLVILDFPDMESIVIRANGIEDGVRASIPDIELIDRVTGGTRDLGYASIKELLESGIVFDVIVSINDAGSLGAIDALEEAKVPYDAVDVYSIDAEQLMVEKILRGQYARASLEVGRSYTAQSSADVITQMLSGASVPEIINIPLSNIVTQDSARTGQ